MCPLPTDEHKYKTRRIPSFSRNLSSTRFQRLSTVKYHESSRCFYLQALPLLTSFKKSPDKIQRLSWWLSYHESRPNPKTRLKISKDHQSRPKPKTLTIHAWRYQFPQCFRIRVFANTSRENYDEEEARNTFIKESPRSPAGSENRCYKSLRSSFPALITCIYNLNFYPN